MSHSIQKNNKENCFFCCRAFMSSFGQMKVQSPRGNNASLPHKQLVIMLNCAFKHNIIITYYYIKNRKSHIARNRYSRLLPSSFVLPRCIYFIINCVVAAAAGVGCCVAHVRAAMAPTTTTTASMRARAREKTPFSVRAHERSRSFWETARSAHLLATLAELIANHSEHNVPITTTHRARVYVCARELFCVCIKSYAQRTMYDRAQSFTRGCMVYMYIAENQF